jgi:hypothetical protein
MSQKCREIALIPRVIHQLWIKEGVEWTLPLGKGEVIWASPLSTNRPQPRYFLVTEVCNTNFLPYTKVFVEQRGYRMSTPLEIHRR